MDIKILKKTVNEIQMEIKKESHTFLNALKTILLEDERVDVAAYNIKFPGISDPILYVRTYSADPIEVIKDAAKKLANQCEEFKTIFRDRVSI
ncbi:MAG TPA: DNA-directed RNA polymerase subunit L [Methanosarcinales archaeon]|nr:DNA-directed RNA polymerase subunit L [Methanosarcinales archaeon]